MIRQSVLGLFVAVSFFAVGCASQTEGASADNAATAGSSTLARDYQGTIGGKPVFIRLASSGSAITGSYFYANVGSSGTLALSGTLTGNKIALTEKVNGAGAATGSWSGTLGAGGAVTGTWKSPSGASLALAMTAIAPGTNQVVTHKYAQTVPYTGTDNVGDTTCQLSGSAFEVFGLSSQAAEDAINKALAVDPLGLDASGKCTDFVDDRTITSTQVMNKNGFLTVSVNTESDGGAHPDIAIDYFNFRLSDGAQFTSKDLFADGAATQLRAMVVANINADTTLQPSDKQDSLDQLDQQWPTDGSFDLSTVEFGVDEQGITLDMTNIYPHVVLALAPSIHFAWSDLKPVLSATDPYAAFVQ